jgi:hypothetical protein
MQTPGYNSRKVNEDAFLSRLKFNGIWYKERFEDKEGAYGQLCR